ncbi:autotransporter domain-containing protein [Comamonas terrigena]|uniref:autotransporter domain-containing protein n=1 Tax=Comamonas terrigena TaxID=32013 RepID=UPI0024497F3F|nr:autotransporter domain-containing protein [Comamonas terrigena]MDH1703044.1 autotransporter outer membrane beta-barrel domain-containing protein [Comamonas terrigena]
MLEPQLQLAYQHLSLDDADIVAANIRQDIDNGWLARAGVRIKGLVDSKVGSLQPYGRINVFKRSSGTDITRFLTPTANTNICSRTGGTSSEFAAGFT